MSGKTEIKEIQLMTKEDNKDLMDRLVDGKYSVQKTIYIVGIIQYLATIGTLFLVLKFMMK